MNNSISAEQRTYAIPSVEWPVPVWLEDVDRLLQALHMTVAMAQSDDEIQVAAIALCLECSTIGLAVACSRSDLTTKARLVAGLAIAIRDALVSGRGPAPRRHRGQLQASLSLARRASTPHLGSDLGGAPLHKNYPGLISVLSAAELEAFVYDWLHQRCNDYHSHDRWSGTGDLGRDVTG